VAGCSEECIQLRTFNQSFFTFFTRVSRGAEDPQAWHDSDGPDYYDCWTSRTVQETVVLHWNHTREVCFTVVPVQLSYL
jgi:hypothetical protein